jgi:hypothetical protein
MVLSRQKSVRRLAVLGLFAILAVAAVGFAAQNTVPATNAGDGQSVTAGYAISNVHYGLNGANPANIDSVSFDIAPAVPAAGEVRVQLVSGGSWYTCNTGAAIVCSTTAPQVTAFAADVLRVVAAQ